MNLATLGYSGTVRDHAYRLTLRGSSGLVRAKRSSDVMPYPESRSAARDSLRNYQKRTTDDSAPGGLWHRTVLAYLLQR